jgi:hypothetical protein
MNLNPFLRKRRMNNFIPAGPLAMIEDVILANGLHRLQFRQAGRIPDLEPLLAQHGPKDGQKPVVAAWMDEQGIGHATIAWKEYQTDPLPGMEPTNEREKS